MTKPISGLDIDALRMVGEGINALREPVSGMLVITHYQRLLDYIVPDFVHVLAGGRIVKTGDTSLALRSRRPVGMPSVIDARPREEDAMGRTVSLRANFTMSMAARNGPRTMRYTALGRAELPAEGAVLSGKATTTPAATRSAAPANQAGIADLRVLMREVLPLTR